MCKTSTVININTLQLKKKLNIYVRFLQPSSVAQKAINEYDVHMAVIICYSNFV